MNERAILLFFVFFVFACISIDWMKQNMREYLYEISN